MGNVFGIDLGTTYSRIAYVDEYGRPVVLESNMDGEKNTPSVVYFEPDSKTIVVGKAAKGMAKVREERVVSAVKRVMGDPNWVFECDGQQYKPQDISAFILKSLVENAKQIKGFDEIKDVVISCPAYFGVNQKEATKQAGEIAGLNVIAIIPEPTAAAIAYGIDQQEDQVVMVYDLGGGTFDITLIDIKSKKIEVIATGGIDQLGGKDWDESIVNYLIQNFETQTGTSYQKLVGDLEEYQKLLTDAEELKTNLTSLEKVEYLINYDGQKARIELTRDTFNEITSNLFEQSITYTKEMIERAKQKGYDKIDKILLVGGSTMMPIVAERLKEFGIPLVQQESRLMVAMGAALYAHYLTVSPNDLGPKVPPPEIINVTAKSFGVVVITSKEGEPEVFQANNIIVRDEQIPKEGCEHEMEYSTFYDNQTGARIKVVENIIPTGPESYVDMEKCTQIAEVELDFLRPLPKGSPVKVWFKLNENGILEMRAQEETTGQKVETNKLTESVLTQKEMKASQERLLTKDIT